ncbi:MAG: hypothetical protein Q8L48_32985 [Archangium sp.]|nr:hypothetical protein [Archangium sp.]
MDSLSLPAPSLEPLAGSRRWPWVRDFTFVGGVTGFMAPYSVIRDVGYASLTGLGGAASGAVLGVFSAWLLTGFGRRWPKLVFLPVGLVLGALWGMAAAAPTALTSMRNLLVLSLLFAGVAGALQLGWFWLSYCYRRVNRRSTFPVVLLASLLGGGLGWAGFAALALLH